MHATGFQRKDDIIRQKLKSRTLIKVFDTKQHFLEEEGQSIDNLFVALYISFNYMLFFPFCSFPLKIYTKIFKPRIKALISQHLLSSKPSP